MSAPPSADGARRLLRHSLATLAYRAGKALRDAPEGYPGFRPGKSTRTASEIVGHVGDLLEWAHGLAVGQPAWRAGAPQPWEQQVARFWAALARLDERLASDEPLHSSPEQLFQGPISDAIAHAGQLALLRRLAGAPIRGENYTKARVDAGRVGPDQAPPRLEFD
jgi:hypothetical protein